MSEKLARSLYETRLKMWNDARAVPLAIAYENVTFTPPDATYLRVFVLRADTLSLDLAGTFRNRSGLFQINIVAAVGNGSGAAETISGELDTLFPNNLRLTNGSFTVQIVSPLRTHPAIPDAPRYTVPVDFVWRADEA